MANRLNLIGTILCIMSVLPLFLAMCLSGSDLMYIGAVCLLLGFVALACIAFVYAGTQTAAMEKLLEEGDYTRQRKSKSRLIGTVSVCYWLIVTAIFMFYTFGPYGNAQPKYSWFIWAIAGILYGAVMAVLRLIGQNSKKSSRQDKTIPLKTFSTELFRCYWCSHWLCCTRNAVRAALVSLPCRPQPD